MSNKRHNQKFDPVAVRGALITTFRDEYPDGFVFQEHYHEVDQVIFACRGVMTVQTTQGMWILPTYRALWIPSGTVHKVRMSGVVSIRTLYLRARLATDLPRVCCVLTISPLLRELILHSCQYRALNRRSKEHACLIGLILRLLHSSPLLALQLPQPTDPRAGRVANFFLNDPGTSLAPGEICRRAGACKRTIERLFKHDTQMTLGRWRQQLRLIHSLRLLAQGMKVSSVALDTGYSSSSSFISMFKSLVGMTPRLYFQETFQSRSRSGA
jgi:AraC-like DNA-binding protein